MFSLTAKRLSLGSTKVLARGPWQVDEDEAVVALCEKRLLAFLRDFLAKQPGVKHILNITILYKWHDDQSPEMGKPLLLGLLQSLDHKKMWSG